MGYFAVSSDDINRHVIGRLLDKIYEYGVERFFMELASHVMKKMGISPESIHADSTSFHYHGESYEEEGAVLLTQGYSRDSHPELKQVCSFMVVDGDSELPLAFEPFDGNKSDKRQFPEFIKLRFLNRVNGVLKVVNTPVSYFRERCAKSVDSVRRLA